MSTPVLSAFHDIEINFERFLATLRLLRDIKSNNLIKKRVDLYPASTYKKTSSYLETKTIQLKIETIPVFGLIRSGPCTPLAKTLKLTHLWQSSHLSYFCGCTRRVYLKTCLLQFLAKSLCLLRQSIIWLLRTRMLLFKIQ